ncbi:MAG TPA: outer membrane protein transport protein [Polyangia bacterium]|nr:outer membrane protein transport protein [Polyangia bacterium]
MRRLLVTPVAALVLTAGFATARAYPFLPPRPVPSAIAGPTDPHVAAIFYNPAALGPMKGLHVWIDGGARLEEGSVDRAPLEGQPRGSASINWANLDAFAGLVWDLNTDSLKVGIATYTPFTDLSSYSASGPLRFHEIDQTFTVLEQTVAAAYQLSDRFMIGAAFNIAESWLSWRFARDAAPPLGNAAIDAPGGLCGGPCGLENPLAEQRVRLRGFGWGLGFSVGVLGKPIDRLWLALSYTSHLFNPGQGADLPLHDQTRAHVTPAPGQGAVCGGGDCVGGDLVVAAIPDIIHAGVRILVTRKFDLESWARWVHYSERAALDVTLQGSNIAKSGVPPQQLYDRGLQDAFGVELSGRWKLGPRWRLAPSLFFETSAVDKSAVSAATLDGTKFDAAVTAEWHPIRWLIVGANAGATAYVIGEVKSRYNPRALAGCADAAFSLDSCTAATAGQGLSSASGNYTLVVVHLSGAIGLEF